jgi:hypothetical protein
VKTAEILRLCHPPSKDTESVLMQSITRSLTVIATAHYRAFQSTPAGQRLVLGLDDFVTIK